MNSFMNSFICLFIHKMTKLYCQVAMTGYVFERLCTCTLLSMSWYFRDISKSSESMNFLLLLKLCIKRRRCPESFRMWPSLPQQSSQHNKKKYICVHRAFYSGEILCRNINKSFDCFVILLVSDSFSSNICTVFPL